MFSTEIIRSYRVSRSKISEHPFMTLWFLILLIAGIWMTLIVIVLIAEMDEPFINPTRRDILFSLFFILMAKASAETSEDSLRNHSIKYYFVTPIRTVKIALSRLLKVFWYNLALIAFVMSLVTLLIHVQGITLPADSMFFVKLYALIILAPCVGFNLAVFSHQASLKDKIILVSVYGQVLTFVWTILHPSLSPSTQLVLIAILLLYSVFITLITTPMFKNAWISGIKGKNHNVLRFHRRKDFLPSIIPPGIRKVAQGEILRRWRNRQIPATIGVNLILSIGLLFIYRQLGPDPDIGLDLGKYFYPALIGITIYTGIVVHSVIPSLTLFSRDGNRLWGFRTAPLDSRSLVWGKASSSLLFSPLTSLVLVLPITTVLEYPPIFILFALAASFCMYFLFTGIGVLMGVVFPNFDESNRGAPDVMTMYSSLMFCLITGTFFLGIPTAVFQMDRILGLLACIFFADMAALVMVILFKMTGKRYSDMEVSM